MPRNASRSPAAMISRRPARITSWRRCPEVGHGRDLRDLDPLLGHPLDVAQHAVLARLNGRWLIAPKYTPLQVKRRYHPGTLILETEFQTETGSAVIVDFMPPLDGDANLVRIVFGRSGQVSFVPRWWCGSTTGQPYHG